MPRWLQFHLSTTVVLLFLAGGLTWLNLVVVGDDIDRVYKIGWPIGFKKKYAIQILGKHWVDPMFPPSEPLPPGAMWCMPTECAPLPAPPSLPEFLSAPETGWQRLSAVRLICDLIIAGAVLCGAGIACEFFIRHRERRP